MEGIVHIVKDSFNVIITVRESKLLDIWEINIIDSTPSVSIYKFKRILTSSCWKQWPIIRNSSKIRHTLIIVCITTWALTTISTYKSIINELIRVTSLSTTGLTIIKEVSLCAKSTSWSIIFTFNTIRINITAWEATTRIFIITIWTFIEITLTVYQEVIKFVTI